MQPVKIHIYSQSHSSAGTENIETTAYGRLAEKIINIMFFMMNLKQQVWQALKLLSSGIMRESLFYAAARWIAGRNLPEVWSVKVCTGLRIWLCRCG